VHMGDGGSFFESVEVIPGCRGAVAPFGSQTSSNLRASERWRQEGRYADDYGAILLSEPFQPSQNGGVPRVVPFAVLPDSALQDATVHISGYPADKPFGTQFRDSDPISHTQAQRLRYMTDTYGGHSGSPVFFGGPEGPSVGIHNYGGCANKATRINENVAQAINTWIAAAGD
jgi:V8-like Glu-specific endopeptidase